MPDWITQLTANENYNCDKKYCKKMSSCAEARYKLEKCGHDELDRDGDGTPCENVCGKPKKKK